MGLVRQVLETLRIPILEAPGFEADDILATLATQGREAGDSVYVLTGDRDVYQLVEDPHVRVLYVKRGVSEFADYDEAGIQERTGVTPALYPQYAALRGDPSDNLPGVPGVGEKTAAKLITTYGGLDGIFEHLDEQTPKLRENLAANEANVRQNHELMVLVRDVPLDLGIDDLTWDQSSIDVDELRRLFEFLEFNTIFDRMAEVLDTDLGPSSAEAEVLEAEVDVIDDPAAAAKVLTVARRRRRARSPWPRRGRARRAAPTSRASPWCATGAPATWCGSRARCSPTQACATRSAALAGIERPAARRPPGQAAGPCPHQPRRRRAQPGPRHRAGRLPPRPRREPLPARGAGGPLRGRPDPRRRRRGRGPARPRRLGHPGVHRHGPPGARGRSPGGPAARGPRRPGAPSPQRRHRGAARRRARPHGGRRRRRRPRRAAAPARPARRRRRAAPRRDRRGGRVTTST